MLCHGKSLAVPSHTAWLGFFFRLLHTWSAGNDSTCRQIGRDPTWNLKTSRIKKGRSTFYLCLQCSNDPDGVANITKDACLCRHVFVHPCQAANTTFCSFPLHLPSLPPSPPSLAGQLRGQGAGANWGKAGVLMWNLIEMCRSKVSSGAERWLGSVLNDCSQQCLSASSLQADNRTASTTAWQTRRKVTLPLHHLHCVKYHYIRQGLMKTLTWAFEWE